MRRAQVRRARDVPLKKVHVLKAMIMMISLISKKQHASQDGLIYNPYLPQVDWTNCFELNTNICRIVAVLLLLYLSESC